MYKKSKYLSCTLIEKHVKDRRTRGIDVQNKYLLEMVVGNYFMCEILVISKRGRLSICGVMKDSFDIKLCGGSLSIVVSVLLFCIPFEPRFDWFKKLFFQFLYLIAVFYKHFNKHLDF